MPFASFSPHCLIFPFPLLLPDKLFQLMALDSHFPAPFLSCLFVFSHPLSLYLPNFLSSFFFPSCLSFCLSLCFALNPGNLRYHFKRHFPSAAPTRPCPCLCTVTPLTRPALPSGHSPPSPSPGAGETRLLPIVKSELGAKTPNPRAQRLLVSQTENKLQNSEEEVKVWLTLKALC